jgi:hypothetical protein
MGGLAGRRLAEVQERRLHYRLERLAQRQARLTSWLEQLQERTAPEAAPERRRGARGGQKESTFSGRIPPHGESEGGDEESSRQQAGEGGDASEEPEGADEGADEDEGEGWPRSGDQVVAEAPEAEEADGDDLRAALFEVFDQLVDRADPALPKVADINAAIDPRFGTIRRSQARPVYEEWLSRSE